MLEEGIVARTEVGENPGLMLQQRDDGSLIKHALAVAVAHLFGARPNEPDGFVQSHIIHLRLTFRAEQVCGPHTRDFPTRTVCDPNLILTLILTLNPPASGRRLGLRVRLRV